MKVEHAGLECVLAVCKLWGIYSGELKMLCKIISVVVGILISAVLLFLAVGAFFLSEEEKQERRKREKEK